MLGQRNWQLRKHMQDLRNQYDLQFVIDLQHLSSGSGVTEGTWTEEPLPHFNLSSPWFEQKHFARDDHVFQFWRVTAHDINMTSLRGHLVLPSIWIRCWYVFIWVCRKHMVRLHMRVVLNSFIWKTSSSPKKNSFAELSRTPCFSFAVHVGEDF